MNDYVNYIISGVELYIIDVIGPPWYNFAGMIDNKGSFEVFEVAMGDIIYYTDFFTPLGRWYIASTGNGVCRLNISGDEKGFFKALNRTFPVSSMQLNHDVHTCIIEQLLAYLHGQLRTFDCPVDLIGTAFQKKVWQALQGIPYGALVSYKDIATAIGMPQAYRAVGNANGRNPVPLIIPCHRVIASDGSLGGYSAGLDLKKKLIALEQGCALF